MIIQKLGLEIRKLGKMVDLYKEVDMVLSKQVDMVSMTAAHSLQKMLAPDKWVDVCTIQTLSKMCNIIIPSERMDIYHAVHCVHWNEMLPEYSRTIMCMILDDFRPILNPKEMSNG